MTRERHTTPTQEGEKFDEVLKQAAESPEVKSGLLLPEQVVYAEAWRREINPNNKDISVLYGGIGPDVAFTFRSTGAKTVYGVDASPPTKVELQRCLLNWDTLETESFPFKHTQGLRNRVTDGDLPSLSASEVHRLFEEKVRKRQNQGNWDAAELDDFTIDRLIMLELKKMGIDPETINIAEEGDDVVLTFEYQNKTRKVIYINANIFKIDEEPTRSKIPNVDIAMVKSVPVTIDEGRYTALDILGECTKDGGVVLYGATVGEQDEVAKVSQGAMRYLDSSGYTPIVPPQEYTDAMTRKTQHLKHVAQYAWRLFGARKPI